ncbi:MAG: sulfatase-like hydrolase/transferase, partial [Candidatus Rokuibacteriota bacterium]
VPSHASLFTGLYPREHGAENPVPMLRGGLPTLASHLGAHGYATVAVTNNPLIYGETGLAAGFDEVRLRPGANGRPRWLGQAEFLLGLADSGAAATTRLVGELLPRLRRPFFLFINYLECHWHYLPPRRFERRFARQNWPQSVRYRLRSRRRLVWEAIADADASRLALYNDLYDAELATLDERFGRLLDHLRRAGLWEETVLLLTSDHGENIGEDGLASHQGSLRQNLIHVPFLAKIPGRRRERIHGLTQFTDAFAGLCRLLDVAVPEHLSERPLAIDPFRLAGDDPGRPFAFAEWRGWSPEKLQRLARRASRFDFARIPGALEAVQDGRVKLVVDDLQRERLYDLVADPGEGASTARPEEAARLREALSQWRAAHPSRLPEDYSPEEHAAVESRLRELGYL